MAGAGADPRPALTRALATSYRAREVTLTASGTQALELAIRTARELAGADALPRVALPAFTCYDVATAAVATGLAISLYDVDPSTLSPDLESLRSVAREGARVIVVAHLYGFPVDWDAVAGIADESGAILIEDAAQGHGARWRNQPAGALGALSVLSFGRGKGWTGSQGGALLARHGAEVSRTIALPARCGPKDEARTCAIALAQWWLARPAWYWLPSSVPSLALGETRYHEPVAVRAMSRAAAALIRDTRGRAMLEMFTRRWHAWEFLARLGGGERLRAVRHHPGAEPGYLRLPLRVEGGWASLDRHEARRLGIAPSYPLPLSRLPAVRSRLAGPVRRFPGAEVLAAELVTVPTHSRLDAEDRAAIARFMERSTR